MKIRPFIYLGAALLIAAAVFLIERPDLPNRGDITDDLIAPDYDAKNITRIEVSQLLSGIQLKREGDAWTVADLATPMRRELDQREGRKTSEPVWFPADRAVVGSALGVFGDLQRGVVVSTNKDNQGLYQVSAPIGLNVRLFEGDRMVIEMTIGKRSSDFSGNYLRIGNSSDVMLGDRVLEPLFPTAVPGWRDRTIWHVDHSKIISISVERPTGSYELLRGDDGWRLGRNGATLDATKVDRLLTPLAKLQASGFASADDPRSSFKRPSLALTITEKGGASHTLSLGGLNNLGQQYARAAGNDQIYLIRGLDGSIPDDPQTLR